MKFVPASVLVVSCLSTLWGCSGTDELQPVADTGHADGTADAGTDTRDTAPPPDSSADTHVEDTTDATPADTAPKPFSTKLSLTSLYEDFSKKKFAPDAVEFAPVYTLWADGSTKRRFIQLPPGTKIDTADMDNWVFPVGTKFWKEFTYDGKKVETRLIERTDVGSYRLGSYVWNDAQTEADYTEGGATNAAGTDWTVPTIAGCTACHAGTVSHINSFQAIQLSKTTDAINLGTISDMGWLTKPPPKGKLFTLPGTAADRAGLGYLHANCGHCHTPLGSAWSTVNQVLRLTVDGIDTVEHTNTYKTAVWVPTSSYKGKAFRIVPGVSADSAVYVRPTHRGDPDQMPPIGTKIVHPDGIAAIKAFVDGMPKIADPDAGVDGGGDAD